MSLSKRPFRASDFMCSGESPPNFPSHPHEDDKCCFSEEPLGTPCGQWNSFLFYAEGTRRKTDNTKVTLELARIVRFPPPKSHDTSCPAFAVAQECATTDQADVAHNFAGSLPCLVKQGLSGPLRLRVQPRLRTRSRIAASIALLFIGGCA